MFNLTKEEKVQVINYVIERHCGADFGFNYKKLTKSAKELLKSIGKRATKKTT